MSELPWEGHIPDQVSRTLAVGGAFIIGFGIVNRFLKEKLFLGEPLAALILGSVLGPFAIKFLTFIPREWDAAEEETEMAHFVVLSIVRVVICIGVLFAAATAPKRYPTQKHNLISLLIIMFPILISAWLVSAGLVKLAIPALGWDFAMVVGSSLGPTDPVLAGSILKGAFAERFVPTHIRHLLSAESAINDGFGTPFVFLVLHFIKNDGVIGDTIVDVLLRTILWNVVLGTCYGILMGYIMRKVLGFVRSRDLMDEEALMVFSLMMVFFLVGTGKMLTTNELLASCFAGFALNWGDELTSHELYTHFSEGIELLNDSGIFFLIGVIMPWKDFFFDPLHIGSLILLGVTVMIFRRLPGILALYRTIPNIQNVKEAFIVGHFGPMGVGALFYALLATEELPEDFVGREVVIPVILFVVLTSVVVHGLSAPAIILTRKAFGIKEGPPPTASGHDDHHSSHAPSVAMDPYGNTMDEKSMHSEKQAAWSPGGPMDMRAPGSFNGGSSLSQRQSRRLSSLYPTNSYDNGSLPAPSLPVSTHVSKRISSMGGWNQYGARRDWDGGPSTPRSATIV